MAALARETEPGREALYRTLLGTGNPTLETLGKALGTLGLSVAVRVDRAALDPRLQPQPRPLVATAHAGKVVGSERWTHVR